MQVLFGSFIYIYIYIYMVGHLYLIIVWLGEDQRTNTIEKHTFFSIPNNDKITKYVLGWDLNMVYIYSNTSSNLVIIPSCT